MLRVAAIGIITVLLALQFKDGKKEYGIVLVMAAGFLIFAGVLAQLQDILATVQVFLSGLWGADSYLTILYKLIGIAYLSEFASSLCKDAGYSFLAGQIELAGKLAILTISMPVMRAVLQTIESVLVR